MKEETTLLLEKEVQEKTEKKVKSLVVAKQTKEQTKNLFSSEVKTEKFVEKPNFDKIEELSPEKRNKIFKVESAKADSSYKVNKKLKLGILGLCFCLLFAFCITTSIEIAKANAELQAEQSAYSANLAKLIKKINSSESGNRASSLFETYPDEDLGATSIYETSNWFDRFCSFLAGFFGG